MQRTKLRLTSRTWHSEPAIEDMLADPIVQLVMRRDGLDAATVRAVMSEARARLA